MISPGQRLSGLNAVIRAVEAAAEGKFGNMVALQAHDIVLVPLKSLAGIVRQVPSDSQLIHTAESIGISLGRQPLASVTLDPMSRSSICQQKINSA